MDEMVVCSLVKWLNVFVVYGWLDFDCWGNWLIKGECIGNVVLCEFIVCNYVVDLQGCWFFQNGLQWVYVWFVYMLYVVYYDGECLVDQCGQDFFVDSVFLDDEGLVLIQGVCGIVLFDDCDFECYVDEGECLFCIECVVVVVCFGFVLDLVLW